MAYNGWRIKEESRATLLNRFVPRFAEVIAHHITLKTGNRFCPQPVHAAVVGYAVDETGIEALVVEVNGSVERADGKTYHITWSLDREAGFKPVSSNTLLENGFTAIDPIEIEVEPFFKDDEGREWTESMVTAVARCLVEGYEDPFFIGTKGYPNWMDFTDEAIARTRAFVAATQAIMPSTKG